ncbi:biotin synthase-like enzyme [Bradyrhizobium sp. RT4b]
MVAAMGVERNDRGNSAPVRHDWQRAEAEVLYGLRFADLMLQAQSIHRKNFDPNRVEKASLLSIKTGGCPEDCGYCSQSAHYDTGLKATRLMDRAEVVATAQCLKDAARRASAWPRPGVVRKTEISIRSAT